ncbi:MAG: vanadium-dependent haloperoxidase, partial [Saprospiraceae bacterium]
MKIKSILFVSLIFVFTTCKEHNRKEETKLEAAKETLLQWNNLILDLEQHTPGYRPPVSARAFAYFGIFALQAAYPFSKKNNIVIPALFSDSINIKLINAEYEPALGLNAGYARILRYFYSNSSIIELKKIDDLEDKIAQKYNSNNVNDLLSTTYGKKVADTIWEYAMSDTIGHEANLYNFDKNFIPEKCKGCWQLTGEHPMPALLPYWGKARTFVTNINKVTVRPPVTYDESRNSPFYTEAMEVFLVSQNRTYDDIWVAELWSDDLPELTVSPVGRWFSIMNQFIAQEKPSFSKCIEAYYKLGIAMNDAAVTVWNAKYQYNLERPETYIKRNIFPDWKPLHETPPFPSYPSGHATFGATAAEVLKPIFGNSFTLADKTHENRQEFKGRPRTYHSFDEMAKENAFSRIPMGVHYRMDCEEGYRLGKTIGQHV